LYPRPRLSRTGFQAFRTLSLFHEKGTRMQSDGEKGAPKKEWHVPALTVHGRVPDDDPARVALAPPAS
jgi:hypothetical protein